MFIQKNKTVFSFFKRALTYINKNENVLPTNLVFSLSKISQLCPTESEIETIITRDWGVKGGVKAKVNGMRKSTKKSPGLKRGLGSSSESIDRLIKENNLASVDEVECIKTITEIAITSKNYQLVADILHKYKQIPEGTKIKLLTLIMSSSEEDFHMLHKSPINGMVNNLLNGHSEDTPKRKKNKKKSRRSLNSSNSIGNGIENMEVEDKNTQNTSKFP